MEGRGPTSKARVRGRERGKGRGRASPQDKKKQISPMLGAQTSVTARLEPSLRLADDNEPSGCMPDPFSPKTLVFR